MNQVNGDYADRLLSEGSACNNFFLYEDALIILNEAIRQNPSLSAAYQERALSHFELGNIEKALEDYRKITKKSFFNKFNYLSEKETSSLDFAKGLLKGSLEGVGNETVEFISCIRGSFTFLWSFACSPYQVSKDIILAVYAMGEFLAHAKISHILNAVLPELIECRKNWDKWSEHTKGWKMGFIIGKYGLSAFFYVTMLRGVSTFNNLKRANIMAILERCNCEKKPVILQQSAKRASQNQSILQKVFKGSIIIHNPNIPFHVLQKKHRWDKLVPLSNNVQQDFKKVVKFLEQQKILQCECTLDFSTSVIKTYRYSKTIGNDTVIAVFEVCKNNIPLLRNAWVKVGS
jgi:tetratricopeptide (TPR) repeat protein